MASRAGQHPEPMQRVLSSHCFRIDDTRQNLAQRLVAFLLSCKYPIAP
jgi:hypothetical protein